MIAIEISPTASAYGFVSGSGRDELGDLLGERPRQARDPEHLGDLAHDHRDREPDDEPGHDRLGQEVGDEPEPGQAGGDKQAADDQGERSRQRDIGAGVAPARSATTVADITAIVELTVTLMWRLVPNTAYAVIAANAVTRPSSAGTPASAA